MFSSTRSRTRVAMTAGALSVAVLATACGGSSGDKAAVAAASLDSCSPDGVTITAQYANQGDEAARQAKTALESKYPGLTVELKAAPANTSYDQLTQQIVADIAAGSRPDVAMVGLNQIRFWVDQYKPVAIDTNSLRETYDHRFLDIGAVDGTPYVAPFQVSVPVLYTNTDLATSAGVDTIPATTSELIANAQKINASNGSAPVQLPRDGIADWPVQALLQSNGAELTDEAGDPAFDTDAGHTALSVYEQLGKDKLQDQISTADALTLFNTGKLAYLIYTPANAANVQKTVGDAFDWTVTAMPVPDGGSPSLPAGGNGWMVLSQDSCKAAYGNELIGAMLDPAVIVKSSKLFSYIPVDTAAAAELAADPAAATQLGYSWTYQGTPTPYGGWHGSTTAKANQFIQDMVQRLVGGEDVDTVVPETVRRIQSAVK